MTIGTKYTNCCGCAVHDTDNKCPKCGAFVYSCEKENGVFPERAITEIRTLLRRFESRLKYYLPEVDKREPDIWDTYAHILIPHKNAHDTILCGRSIKEEWYSTSKDMRGRKLCPTCREILKAARYAENYGRQVGGLRGYSTR